MTAWNPTQILRVDSDPIATSMAPVRVMTDAGMAHLKPMRHSVKRKQGCHHSLAVDFLGSILAREVMRLPVPEMAILPAERMGLLSATDADVIVGPALASQTVLDAHSWHQTRREFEKTPGALEFALKMVVFDTWTLNWDRQPPAGDTRPKNFANLLLAMTGGVSRVIPIDQSQCWLDAGYLRSNLSQIGRWQDERVYGLFPVFRQVIAKTWTDAVSALPTCLAFLQSVSRADVEGWIASIPREWMDEPADAGTPSLWAEHICRRAAWLADNATMLRLLAPLCSPHPLLEGGMS